MEIWRSCQVNMQLNTDILYSLFIYYAFRRTNTLRTMRCKYMRGHKIISALKFFKHSSHRLHCNHPYPYPAFSEMAQHAFEESYGIYNL